MGRDTEELTLGQSSRDRLLRVGLVTSLANRGVALFVPLVSLPILLTNLGADRYGLWVTATSLAAILVVFDLGVGNATLTYVAATRSDADRAAAVRTMYGVGFVVCLALLLMWALATFLTDVEGLFGAREIPQADFVIHLAVVAGIIQLPASLVYKVQVGLGRQASANNAQTLASVLVLIGLIGLAATEATAVMIMMWVAWCPVLMATAYTLVCAVAQPDMLKGALKGPGQRPGAQLRVGLPMFVVSILMLVSQNLDPLLVGWTLGYESVQEFAVPFRIFSAVSALAVMFSAPLWALNSEALSRGDAEWVRTRTRKVALLGGLFVGMISLAVVLVGRMLVEVWLRGAIEFDWKVWVVLGGVVTMQALSGPFFMVQNSVAFMNFQLFAYALVVMLAPLKIMVLRSGGVTGMVVLLLAIQMVMLLPCALLGASRVLERQEASRA